MSAAFDNPPIRTPFFGESQDGTPSWAWKRWLQAISVRLTSPVIVDAPLAADSTGIEGQIAHDDSFIYVCVARNTWKRVAISAF